MDFNIIVYRKSLSSVGATSRSRQGNQQYECLLAYRDAPTKLPQEITFDLKDVTNLLSYR